MSEFMCVASHDLKTPVTTTKIYLQLIEEHFKKTRDELHLKFAEKAVTQINKLSTLINNLLDVSKLNAGTLEFEKAEVIYSTLMDAALVVFKNSTETHLIEVKGNSSAIVLGDRERLIQAMLNLLSNAAKYSPKADKIMVYILESDTEVITSITDYGSGIPASVQEGIFNPFLIAKDKPKSGSPGLGVGLFMAAEIIKQHGGNIWVNSKEGNETTFTFTIPFVKTKKHV
jgi:signal transduction histidine kinase